MVSLKKKFQKFDNVLVATGMKDEYIQQYLLDGQYGPLLFGKDGNEDGTMTDGIGNNIQSSPHNIPPRSHQLQSLPEK